jgi:hypothetical protein
MRKILASVALLVAACWLSATSALANQYAIGYINNGNSYGGGYIEIYIQSMYTPDCGSGGHINNTDWVYTNSSLNYWTEVGYTYGYHGSCQLTYYWARDNAVNGYADYNLNRIGSIGTLHLFEGQEVVNGEYDVYVDNSKVGADVNGYPWTKEVDTGLEYTSTSSSLGHSVTYLYNQVRNTSCCTWVYWPTGSTYNSANHTWTWNTHWTQGTVSN